jgi:toxin ParE1/3/4
MQIKWFGDAIADLVEIRNYIANDKPQTAKDVANRIRSSVDMLKDNPGMGRAGRVPNTKELVVDGLPYIVPYRVKGNVVQILRVLHGALEWPEGFKE